MTAAVAEVVPLGADPLSDASLARELATRFLLWDAFVAGCRRVDVHPLLLPRALHEAAVGDEASLVRVDLLLDAEGSWRACEINADCPGGHNEALGLPRLARAAGFSSAHDPTQVVPRLIARLSELAEGGAVGILPVRSSRVSSSAPGRPPSSRPRRLRTCSAVTSAPTAGPCARYTATSPPSG
jgi:hypothetical protein